MFGDKPIFGQTILNIDSKNRIIVPIYTNREYGEELLLLYNKDFDIYEIYSTKRLEERYIHLNYLVLNATNKKEKNFYEKRLLELSKSILKSIKVEVNGKIALGKYFEGQKELLCTGANDHLIIEPVNHKK